MMGPPPGWGLPNADPLLPDGGEAEFPELSPLEIPPEPCGVGLGLGVGVGVGWLKPELNPLKLVVPPPTLAITSP